MCCRADKINANNAVKCSVHFVGSDYKDDMKFRLLGIDSPVRQSIGLNTVPSFFLPKGMLCYRCGKYTVHEPNPTLCCFVVL